MYAIRLDTTHRTGGTRKRYWFGPRLKDAIARAPGTLRNRWFWYSRLTPTERFVFGAGGDPTQLPSVRWTRAKWNGATIRTLPGIRPREQR